MLTHYRLQNVAEQHEGKTPLGHRADAGIRLALVVDTAGSAALLAQNQLEQLLELKAGQRAQAAATGERHPASQPATRGTGLRGG